MDRRNITLKDYLFNHLGLKNNQIMKYRDFLTYHLGDFIKLDLPNRAYKKIQSSCAAFIVDGMSENDDSVDAKISDTQSSDVLVSSISGMISNEIFELSDLNVYIEKIEDLPFSVELLEMVFPYSIIGKLNCVKQQRFNRFMDLLDVDYLQFMTWPGAGHKKWSFYEKMKDTLVIPEMQQSLLDVYNTCFVRHTFPNLTNLDTDEFPIGQKIDLAIQQYIKHYERISEYREKAKITLKYLKHFFLERRTYKEVAEIMGCTGERSRQIKEELIHQLLNGALPYAENLSLSDTLKEEIRSLINRIPDICSEKTLFKELQWEHYEDTAISILLPFQPVPTDRAIGKAPYTDMDQVYYIHKNRSLTWANTYLKSVCGVLGRSSKCFDVRPMEVDAIMERLDQLENAFEFDKDIVLQILEQHEWIELIESNDGVTYQLKYPYLDKNYKYLARLVYEKKTLWNHEADELHRLYMADPNQPSILLAFNTVKKNIPWVVYGGQNGLLVYNEEGKNRKLLRQAVWEWTQEHAMFTFSDIIIAMQQMGYENIPENSLRTYIYETCRVEKKQNDLFCHQDYIEKYSIGHNWRKKTQEGIVHWLIVTIHGYLMNQPKGTMHLMELSTLLTKDAEDEGYEIRCSLETYLMQYIGDGGVFKQRGKHLELTDYGKNLSAEDLESIGRRNRKPGYYDVVLSKVVATLKGKEDGMMPLLDLRNECMNEIDELTFPSFYRIMDYYLPDQVVKKEIDGKLYLKLVEEKIVYVDSMVLQPVQADVVQQEEPIIRKEEELRPILGIGQAVVVDWDVIRQDLCTQLGFYANQWNIPLPFEQSVDKFIRFFKVLGGNGNIRLNQQIPQCLTMLWHYRNDVFAYTNYLTNIVTCYERLLREIHVLNTGETLNTTGLIGTVKMMDDVYSWSNSYDRKGYDPYCKYFNYLRKERNNIAHGEELLSHTLLQVVQAVYQYIALYIYTVARFWKE